ncbi:NUDIX hydrolase [Nocardia takedensis]|uniref:NUDIX hydrolase n=1 Tax=Nocardia takedensis TaxID=259390 RepID=UPI0003188260|nr:NUDIX domain-containing protein [Nocardia takedensis]
MPASHLVDAHILLRRDGELLLSRRRSGDEFDGRWHLPAGKVEAGESVAAGAVREAREEIGVELDPADLTLVHVAHVVAPGRPARLGLFFETRRWAGEVRNVEPDKCYELRWFPADALPADIIAYPLLGIDPPALYSEYGWGN